MAKVAPKERKVERCSTDKLDLSDCCTCRMRMGLLALGTFACESVFSLLRDKPIISNQARWVFRLPLGYCLVHGRLCICWRATCISLISS